MTQQSSGGYWWAIFRGGETIVRVGLDGRIWAVGYGEPILRTAVEFIAPVAPPSGQSELTEK